MRAASLALLVSWTSIAAAAPPVPRGRAAERPLATHVVVRAADLDASGVTARLSPGVAVAVAGGRRVIAGKVSVRIASSEELGGKMAAAALGARVLAETDLRDPRTKGVVGKARPGALVRIVAEGAGDVVIEAIEPLHARFSVPANAVGAAIAELVLPVPEGRLATSRARTELRAGPEPRAAVAAILDAGARLDVVARSGDRLRARTYGGIVVEGWLPAAAVAEDAGAPAEPSRGLKPSHEALVDVPAFADPAGKRRVGTLRGGALVTVGVEKSGVLVKAMTYGDVIAEVWIPAEDLRPLDPSVWAEGP